MENKQEIKNQDEVEFGDYRPEPGDENADIDEPVMEKPCVFRRIRHPIPESNRHPFRSEATLFI